MPKKTILFLICSMLLIGCASNSTVTYVLHKEEIERVKEGQVYNAVYNGWFFSDRAVDRVMNAKIKGIDLK